LGQIGGCVFLGLPGNPVSSLISLLLVGRPLLHRLGGADKDAIAPPAIQLPSAVSLARSDNRTSYLRAALVSQADGLRALPYFSQDSSLISSLVNSQGLIEVGRGDRPIAVGAAVDVHLFDRLMR
jgi:molybdopterin molybdotransferase